jgi:CheY-like chemotaxis protein
MKQAKIVIVDDSPFSIALIKDMLIEIGCNVVGEASSLEETIDVVKNTSPDIVTMDITMPGADGFECTEAIHNIDPKIKVIIVSSMMDDEIIRKAKRSHISGYVQKPVDKDELSLSIHRITADNELYEALDPIYYSVFKECFIDAFNKLTKSIPEFSNTFPDSEKVSSGISIIIGIIGKYSGRVLFDISPDAADKLAAHLLKRKAKNPEEVLNVLSELSNVISGNACSVLNRKNKIFGFRVSPPTVFHGDSLTISKSKLESATCSNASTIFGDIYMSVGFQRRAAEWMSNI